MSLRGSFPLVLAAIYLACILVVDPRGEFPLNDDWSYTRSAFRLAQDAKLQIDPWAAPSLVGQALYGAALARAFGSKFLVLRLSTLALGCGLAWILWTLLARVGADPGFVRVSVLTWLFNPIGFALSFTFMTEVPFLFFAGLGLLLLVRHLDTGRPAWLLACGAALGFAYLIRQTAALYIVAAALALVAAGRSARPRTLLLFAAAVPLPLAYHVWRGWSGGATPALRRKTELLRHLTVEQLAGNTFALVFYLAFLLLPLALYLLPRLTSVWKQSSPRLRRSTLAAFAALAAAGLAWFHVRYSQGDYLPSKAFHARMPFTLNVLYDTGLGPLTLDPTYYRAPPTPTYPVLWTALTIATAAATVCLGTLLALGLLRDRRAKLGSLRTFLGLAAGLTAAFEIFFSHLQEGGLFDRHVLAALLPALILLAVPAGSPEAPPARGASMLSAAALALFASFSVGATHDYFQWNRLRWELGRGLLARGVDPLRIAGGFEFNAWNNYDTFRARGGIEKVFFWWYDARDYLIAMAPEPGYRTASRREYFSWVHRQGVPVYLLEKSPP